MNHLQICEYTKARCIKVTFEIFALKLILATIFVTLCLVDVRKRKKKFSDDSFPALDFI